MEQRTTRVLVVEDDADVRELLQAVLEKAGYAVIAVDQGATAQQALETVPCDLLISDYHLPGILGTLLIVDVRTAYPHIATMLISGEPNVEDIALLCGADSWFRKGESMNVFLSAVSMTCKSKCRS